MRFEIGGGERLTAETEKAKFHPNWLRIMYVINIFVNGVLGFALLVAPNQMFSLMGFPAEEPIWAGAGSSISFAGGILYAIGLRSPLKYAPLLLLQLLSWVAYYPAIIIPMLVNGTFPSYATFFAALGVVLLIGDLIVIPWRHLLTK